MSNNGNRRGQYKQVIKEKMPEFWIDAELIESIKSNYMVLGYKSPSDFIDHVIRYYL